MFLITEYVVRNFIIDFKYHRVGFWAESVPIAIAAVVTSIFSWKAIVTEKFAIAFLKISIAAISGFLTAEVVNFVQWYWIVAPEYRQVEGDMELALGWLYFLSGIAALKIAASFLILIALVKGVNSRRAFNNTGV